jgi:uncharacterized RDD family membrane protein YckC
MADNEYFSRSWFALRAEVNVFTPWWTRWVDIVEQVWTWSEVIVLLTNRKRRALHDFLAGTIVIVVRPEEKPAAATAASTAAD